MHHLPLDIFGWSKLGWIEARLPKRRLPLREVPCKGRLKMAPS